MPALHDLPAPLLTAMALLMVAAIITLIAWALQLMQAASDRREFSLMLAGCMVCSAAVGLATVMLLTFTSPRGAQAGWSLLSSPAPESAVSLDAITLPWEGAVPSSSVGG